MTATDLQAALEKELVKKLAETLWVALDKPYPTYAGLVQEELLPLVHSHTQALVAAAYAACAIVAHDLIEEFDMPDGVSAAGARKAARIEKTIRSITPADAARELERRDESVRADTIMRFRKVLDRLGIHGYYNEMQSEFGCEEASLSKPAPERCPSQFLGAFCELPKGHLGNHCGDHGVWKETEKPAPVERSNENG